MWLLLLHVKRLLCLLLHGLLLLLSQQWIRSSGTLTDTTLLHLQISCCIPESDDSRIGRDSRRSSLLNLLLQIGKLLLKQNLLRGRDTCSALLLGLLLRIEGRLLLLVLLLLRKECVLLLALLVQNLLLRLLKISRQRRLIIQLLLLLLQERLHILHRQGRIVGKSNITRQDGIRTSDQRARRIHANHGHESGAAAGTCVQGRFISGHGLLLLLLRLRVPHAGMEHAAHARIIRGSAGMQGLLLLLLHHGKGGARRERLIIRGRCKASAWLSSVRGS